MATLSARVAKLEKTVGAAAGERRTWSLEQLVRLSYGEAVGPLARRLRPGEKTVEKLLLCPR